MGTEISRRRFIRTGSIMAAGTVLMPLLKPEQRYPVRLGAPVPGSFTDPGLWSKAVRELGYSAAYCPLQPGAPEGTIRAFRDEAKSKDIIIAEVGAWCNTLDPAEKARKENIEKNIAALRLADEIGAVCCVNISGARGEKWDGPYPGNYFPDTFDMIVETVRKIVDAVKPVSAFYTLEPMPYMLPDSPESCIKLLKAIQRKQVGVHFDPVNMISSPQRYFNNGQFLKDCFSVLRQHIKSIHAKDILLMPELTVHLEERRPGSGNLDYAVFLYEASRLKDVPFMLEHLGSQEDYKLAAEYVRFTGTNAGVTFR